jgi:hypothetical protein
MNLFRQFVFDLRLIQLDRYGIALAQFSQAKGSAIVQFNGAAGQNKEMP